MAYFLFHVLISIPSADNYLRTLLEKNIPVLMYFTIVFDLNISDEFLSVFIKSKRSWSKIDIRLFADAFLLVGNNSSTRYQLNPTEVNCIASRAYAAINKQKLIKNRIFLMSIDLNESIANDIQQSEISVMYSYRSRVPIKVSNKDYHLLLLLELADFARYGKDIFIQQCKSILNDSNKLEHLCSTLNTEEEILFIPMTEEDLAQHDLETTLGPNKSVDSITAHIEYLVIDKSPRPYIQLDYQFIRETLLFILLDTIHSQHFSTRQSAVNLLSYFVETQFIDSEFIKDLQQALNVNEMLPQEFDSINTIFNRHSVLESTNKTDMTLRF